MCKRTLFFILLTGLFFFVLPNLTAQNNSEWQPIFLQVTGANTMNGVQASFQINSCNGIDVVYVKFINHNQYPVKIEWFDGIFTQELKWIYKNSPSDKKSITLPINGEAIGDCFNNHYKELIVKLNDFVAEKKDFKRYSASQLMVIAIQ